MNDLKPQPKPATTDNPKASAELRSKDLLGEIVFNKTPKGEALVPLVKLFMRLDKTKKPSARNGIIAEILEANEKFQRDQKEDGILLIQRAFA